MDFLSEASAIVGGEGITEDLDMGFVVKARDALHEVRGGVITEVRRDVTNPQPATAGNKILRILIGGLV